MGASAGDEELRGLWWSLYDPIVADKCSHQEQDLRGFSILLGITFSCFKRLKVQYNNVKHEYELTTNRLQSALNDLTTIEGEFKRKNEKPCERCQVLANELDTQKKKARVNEERMKSIAHILNLGSAQKPSSDGDHAKQSQFAYAYTVVSQMLHCDADEPAGSETHPSAQEQADEFAQQQKQVDCDVKKACHENNLYPTEGFKFKCFDDFTVLPESVLPDKPKAKIIIPETMLDEEEDGMNDVDDVETFEQSTPEKQLLEKCGKENCSPVIRSSTVRPPVRSGDVATTGASCWSTKDKAPATSLASPSLLSGDDDKLTHYEAAEKRPKLKEDLSRKQADTWVLKPSDEILPLTRCGVGRPASRKLMQTKLSLARLPRKVDVSSTQEFAGGIQHTSTLVAPHQPDEYDEVLQKVLKESLEDHVKKQENEDIIQESPKSSSVKSLQCSWRSSHARSKMGRQDAAKRSSDLDETFLPQVTQDATKRTRTCNSQSTEQLLAELGMPAQATASQEVQPLTRAVCPSRVPDELQTHEGPGYVYQRDSVRGKRERSKLKGWACDDCRDLYEGLHLTAVEKKALINECSRHRDKFPVRSSSPSDW